LYWLLPLILCVALDVAAAPKGDGSVAVSKVFETSDEVVLKVVVQASEAMQYVIRSKDRSGESAAYATMSAVGKSKRFEGISWVLISRVTLNQEDRTFEKVIVQHGATNSTSLGRHVRGLPKDAKPILINERVATGKLRVPLNETVELVQSEDLKVVLILDEQLK